MLGAEVVPIGAGRSAYAFGDQRLNVHGPDTDVGSLVATEPVRPGNADLCFVWPGPIEEAVEHLRGHHVEPGGRARSSVPAAGGGAGACTSEIRTAPCSS